MNGETLPEYVTETLAWQVLAELVRRHPNRLWVATGTHSIGTEQAFILDSGDGPVRPIGYLGLPGANATSMISPGGPSDWRDFYRAADPRDWLLDFERSLGLTAPIGRLPASTGSSLAVRWIAGFLRMQLGGRTQWIAGGEHRWPTHNGNWHGLVPSSATWPGGVATPRAIEPIFLGERSKPRLAVTSAGDLWSGPNQVTNLLRARTPGQSVAQLIVETSAEFHR